MKIRTRLCLAFLILTGGGFYALVYWIAGDLRPRYFATMEETMVDTATLLASFVENELHDGVIQTGGLQAAFDSAREKRFRAVIFEATKTQVNMQVYVTDHNGTVVFDSMHGKDEGKDYSRWNDVVRTMRGEYGARGTRLDPDDPLTEVLHVAAPIRDDERTIGVLTVSKPARSIALFLKTARVKIIVAACVAALAVVVLGIGVSLLVTRPVERLTRYARAVRDGQRVAPPGPAHGELSELGAAFEEMRVALEGKEYVEEYVQALTHQMKSPLSAIRGAAELLEEDMPPEQHAQFLENLKSESSRIQDLVDRMLQLSSLENRNQLLDVEDIELGALLKSLVEEFAPTFASKQVELALEDAAPITVRGEGFLLEQAAANLLQNALDFSEPESKVVISAATKGGQAEIRIQDDGPGIPNYALDKVFDRFYSLPRPGTGRKSTGLGLPFVRETAKLHGGQATLANRPEGGAEATLTLPLFAS